MVWISLDELLERVMLKLYKQWNRPLLSEVRPLLDDERLRLASALRTLASANVNQSEDALILFMERLGSLESVHNLLEEELTLLPEVKQSVQRSRRPSMRLRGYRAKPTNLSPARMQTLLALLEALDPPIYAVTRMFFPEDFDRLAMLLEAALVMVYDAWDDLALETRGAVLRSVHAIRVGLMEDDEQLLVTVRSAVETLHQFEAMPEVMDVARDAFLMGKVDVPPESPFRFNAMIGISDKLAAMVTEPPPITPDAEAESVPEEPREEPETPPDEAPPEDSLPEVDLTPVIEPIPPGLAARRPSSQAIERDFYTDVRFHQQVRAGEKVPLIVRLTRSPFAFSRADGQMTVDFDHDGPEYVEVVVMAHGFEEVTATWSRTLAVYIDRDSQPALFLLRAGMELGEQRVTLDFYHKGRYLSSAAFTTHIVEQAPAAVAGVTIDAPALTARFIDQPPPPADLELRITRGSQDNVLQFMLHSSKPGVGYHWRPMGQIRLATGSPQSYLETIFGHLGELAAQPVDELNESDARFAAQDLDTIGRQLFTELFPAELQQEFWSRILPQRRSANNPKGLITSLLITSDEPWIPWEMIKPVRTDPETDLEQSAGFLAESFQVSRWLAGRSPADEVHIKRACLIAPDTGLLYAEREEAYFRQLPARHVEVDGPLRSADEVRDLARSGGVQLVHFAAHGRFDSENADLSPLTLNGGTLTPYDLIGERAVGLRRERPLVFLNACHTARLAFTLTSLGGWAERMIADVGVSAFVGTLWEVNDLLAAEFAIVFYDRLLDGDTLGQAFYAARLAVRERQPGNPTWLAYVLYGDPNSRIVWGSDAREDESSSPEESAEATSADVVVEDEPTEPEVDIAAITSKLEATLVDLLPTLFFEMAHDLIPEIVTRAMSKVDETDAEAEGEEEEAIELGDDTTGVSGMSSDEPFSTGQGNDESDAITGDSVGEMSSNSPGVDASEADTTGDTTADTSGEQMPSWLQTETPTNATAATDETMPTSSETTPREPSNQAEPANLEGDTLEGDTLANGHQESSYLGGYQGEKWAAEPWDEAPASTERNDRSSRDPGRNA